MPPISKDIALKFCGLCNWVYEAWITHKLLFDDNEAQKDSIGKAAAFMVRLSTITQEYSLLQIAKLHDPAIQKNSLNLTVDYMMRFGEWGERRGTIENIFARLLELWEHLKPARSKALAHNDLETILSDVALGSFPAGTDNDYFAALQDFVNEVHDKWVGGPYPFNDLVTADVQEFVELLERASSKNARSK